MADPANCKKVVEVVLAATAFVVDVVWMEPRTVIADAAFPAVAGVTFIPQSICECHYLRLRSIKNGFL